MDRIKKNFGFGCMRLPMIGEEVDIEQTKQMVDAFLDAGFNYFDTAHGYIQGKSEKALKTCLTSRYPREKYILTDKLTANYFKTEADIRPFFESQLEICGVEYFDFYLMHAQGLVNYDHFKECRAYETAFALKKEGKIRHALYQLDSIRHEQISDEGEFILNVQIDKVEWLKLCKQFPKLSEIIY